MRGFYTFFSIMACWLMHTTVYGQQRMEGQILDVGTRKPLSGVSVHNVYTKEQLNSNNSGEFDIEVDAGQLVEFTKDGYKVFRVRIPNGKLPSYFRVMMQEQGTDVIDYISARGRAPDYKTDSIRYYLLYKETLEFPRLSGLDAIQHPFSAMSKRNQQIWAFQDEFTFYQQQKYIDYIFNKDLVHQITGLTSDSLDTYMQMFRPTYTQLRNMNEYAYYTYIKTTGDAFKDRGLRARMSPIRGRN